MRLNEVFLMRMELAELLPTLGERQWALLSNISNENSTVTVNENFHVSVTQREDRARYSHALLSPNVHKLKRSLERTILWKWEELVLASG